MHMLPRSQEVNIRRLYGSAKKAIDEIAKEKTETQKLEAVEKLVYESFLGNDGKFGQGSETAARDASKFTPETVSNFTRDIVSATTNAAANKPTQASLEPSDNLKKITKGPGLQASFRMDAHDFLVYWHWFVITYVPLDMATIVNSWLERGHITLWGYYRAAVDGKVPKFDMATFDNCENIKKKDLNSQN
ncbi:predicted protein [Sclerotinia sclerotiorum 1980 UF-70]|uniref:Uncharacterized protein n=1 Tax=Sclerotinia sclerotiorum (strain ATCC 18683 / 1980 / Ss-1) TaxID=665079 RepID=A7EIM2_SCLS1|nr:predicted protein [Sclerotinia sclerotiorum 1980 UF-70]EDO02688.1 predicted protein [Sclerotinia sclerotiorum 1980 UF-70]